MNIEAIIKAAGEEGLASHVDFIRKLARPAVDIRLETSAAGLLESRFGGFPALPPDFEWPKHDMGTYQFLGQINFSEITSPPLELPTSGLLSLFFATDPDGEISWHDPGYVLGYFTPDLTTVIGHSSPNGSKPPSSRIILETSIGLPRSPDLKFDWPFSDADADIFFDELPAKIGAPSDYLLGYPSFNTLAYDPTPGDDWISLITLRSHDHLDWCWHDGDKLMVFIEKEKLAGHDFTNLNCDAG